MDIKTPDTPVLMYVHGFMSGANGASHSNNDISHTYANPHNSFYKDLMYDP